MRRFLLFLIPMTAARAPAPETVVVFITATRPPPTETISPPTPTPTIPPTSTPTPPPSKTPTPSMPDIEITAVEQALRDAGYRRYPEMVDIGPYDVRFSLWWWQSTCPAGYICWYENFPGLEFTGDSSFIFYTIAIVPWPPSAMLGPST